jgi:hypothetical protein
MAHSFSYSGNPQGCDHAIRHLHTALENLQARLTRQPVLQIPNAEGSPRPLGASNFATSPGSAAYPLNSPPALTPGQVQPSDAQVPTLSGPTSRAISLTPVPSLH